MKTFAGIARRRPRLVRWVRGAARAGTLAATTWALVATSAPDDPVSRCEHVDQTVTFDVTGTCGPPGTIIVQSPAHSCGLFATNAASVGLPSGGHFETGHAGRRYDLLRGRWTLSGYVPLVALARQPLTVDAEAQTGEAIAAAGGSVPDAGSDGGPSADGGAASDGGLDARGDASRDAAAPPGAPPRPDPDTAAPGFNVVRRCRMQLAGESSRVLSCEDEGGAFGSCTATLTLVRTP